MGQEWAASTPFCYFTDHHDELGVLVSEGRRHEFADFRGFAGTEIPDPQSIETFKASQLRWDELTTEPHAGVLRLYKSLLRMRRLEPSTDLSSPDLQIEAVDDNALLLNRTVLSAVIRLRGQGAVELGGKVNLADPVWNSEDLQFTSDSQPILVDTRASRVVFSRPGAIVFRTATKENA